MAQLTHGGKEMKDLHINIDYNDLTKEKLQKENSAVYRINKNNKAFYFNMKLNKKNKRLLILSNGAIDRRRKNPPIFMRSSWAKDIDANCIFIDDPTLHDNKLFIGWGVGNPEHHYLKSISDIIIKIANLCEFDKENIVYYGSSAGGTMSIMLSTYHQGTTALANNPQAFAINYKDGTIVDRLRRHMFSDMPLDELLNQYNSRFSITDCFLENNYVPSIYYLYNVASEEDYELQYLPLIKEMKTKDINKEKIQFKPYNNPRLGHAPFSKAMTLKWIHTVFRRIES